MFFATLAALTGCDTSFDAFEETDLSYSVYGLLDARADTQYVRVEPVQDSTFTGTESLDARVTSENLETGETVVWNDSTFFIGANEVPVRNFWTDVDLKAGATYRLRVERERDGATSTAEVTLPSPFSRLEVAGNLPALPQESCDAGAPPTVLEVEGVEHLGAVRVDYDYLACTCPPARCIRRQTTTYPLADTLSTGEASWTVEIYWADQIPDVGGFYVEEIYSFRVAVASVSETWPEYAEGDLPGNPTDVSFPPPGERSNVEGGTGFVGGAFTHTAEVPVRQ